MAFIRKYAYLRFILCYIGVFASNLFFDYKNEHIFNWSENLFESLIYVGSYTLVMRLLADNNDNEIIKEDTKGEVS